MMIDPMFPARTALEVSEWVTGFEMKKVKIET